MTAFPQGVIRVAVRNSYWCNMDFILLDDGAMWVTAGSDHSSVANSPRN